MRRQPVPLGRSVIQDQLRIQWLPRVVFTVAVVAIVSLWRKEICIPPQVLLETPLSADAVVQNNQAVNSEPALVAPQAPTDARLSLRPAFTRDSDWQFAEGLTNEIPHLARRQ